MVSPKVLPKIPVAPKIPRSKFKTKLIDPKLPRGKVGKGPLEPRDSTTRVPAGQNKRFGLAGMLKKRKPTKESPNTQSPGGGSILGISKGPGMKNGGSVMKYKDGGCVAGAANRRRMMQEMVNK